MAESKVAQVSIMSRTCPITIHRYEYGNVLLEYLQMPVDIEFLGLSISRRASFFNFDSFRLPAISSLFAAPHNAQ
jgi:hypothetical protein